MNISLNELRTLKINNSFDIFHIDAPCSNISSNKNLQISLKIIHNNCSLVLIFISMQHKTFNSQSFLNKPSDFLTSISLISKHKHFSLNMKLMEVTDDPFPFLLPCFNYHHILHHVFVCCTLLPHYYPYRSQYYVIYQKLHLFLHCCCEKESLPVLPCLSHNRPNLLLKSQ